MKPHKQRLIKRPISYLMTMVFVLASFFSSASAADQEEKDENRLLNSGT